MGPTTPNAGDPTFTTSFADAGDPGNADIASDFPSPLLSGQFLVTGDNISTGPLTLTFDSPVYQLTVDFGLNAGPGSGALLELVTSAGTYDQPDTSPGGPFAGGVLSYSSLTPFTSATLQGFAAQGLPIYFAIDNLDLSTVPEPSSLALMGAVIAGIVTIRKQRS